MLASVATGGLTLGYSFGSRAAVSVHAGRAAPLTMIADGATQLFHARGDTIDSLPFMLQANLEQEGHAPRKPHA